MTVIVTHELKILPEYFEPVYNRVKTFEIRVFDRDFKVGDWLHLAEWSDPDGYTGRSRRMVVRSIVDDERFGLKPGWVCMSVDKLWHSR